MTLSSSRNRFPRRREATQQLIVFRILCEWFALPIRIAYKVVPIGQVYGSNHADDIRLTRYQNQDVLVLNVRQRIFGEKANQALLPSADLTQIKPIPDRHLLLICTPQGELVGIPLENPPVLRHVPESAFTPIPTIYLVEGSIRCVSALITVTDNEPPIFLLNPNQLLQSSTPLLSSEASLP